MQARSLLIWAISPLNQRYYLHEINNQIASEDLFLGIWIDSFRADAEMTNVGQWQIIIMSNNGKPKSIQLHNKPWLES